jgi:GNAT superfamily N-acetyltransferase
MSTAPDGYPGGLIDELPLSGDRRLRIRPLHQDEDSPVRELDARLSRRTRYLRFLSPTPALPESVLRVLVSADYRRALSLVAEVDTYDRREVVGLGSFGAIGNGTAEVGLVVCDEWQRRGVGTILANHLMQAAEERGFARFVGHVLAENVPIRRLIRRVGHVISTTTRGAMSEVTFVRRSPANP